MYLVGSYYACKGSGSSSLYFEGFPMSGSSVEGMQESVFMLGEFFYEGILRKMDNLGYEFIHMLLHSEIERIGHL
jgi:hypothetical protein